MPVPLITGADLAAWRARLSWSTQRAAAELRVLPASLRNLEAGRKTASPALLRLAEVLEQLASAPAAAATVEKRPTPTRKPRPRKAAPAEPSNPFEAAMSRAGIRTLRPAALALLREAVDRRLAGYVGGPDGGPEPGEDLAVWRQRERDWHAAREAMFSARLDWIARKVERELTNAGRPVDSETIPT